MSRDWWIILRFAILGLVVATVFFAFFETKALAGTPVAVWVIGAAAILCPGFLPFIWAAAVEMDIPNLRIIWLIVGLINCVVYAVLGAIYVRLRNWRAGTARV
jgi:hypothetical protein